MTTAIATQPQAEVPCAGSPPRPLAKDFQAIPRVGLDELDALVFRVIPPVVRGGAKAEEILVSQISSLAAEGGRGPTMRRLLARETCLTRASERYVQSLLHAELRKLGQRRGHVERVERIELLARLTDAAHRRLLAVVDRTLRLDTPLAPRVRVTAHQAQVNVGEVGR